MYKGLFQKDHRKMELKCKCIWGGGAVAQQVKWLQGHLPPMSEPLTWTPATATLFCYSVLLCGACHSAQQGATVECWFSATHGRLGKNSGFRFWPGSVSDIAGI